MISKRDQAILLFAPLSWGLSRGISEALGILLFPGVTITDTWSLYHIRGFSVYACTGILVGLSTWCVFRWLKVTPDVRGTLLLVGGFLGSWSLGYGLVVFFLDTDTGWSWNTGYLLIGACSGLVVGQVLRGHIPALLRRFLLLPVSSAGIFLVTNEFSMRLIGDLEAHIPVFWNITIVTGLQTAFGGMLMILLVLWISGKIERLLVRWRDAIFAWLAFALGNALSILAFYWLSSEPLMPWVVNGVVAVGLGAGMMLAARRPRSIPLYVLLLLAGVTLGRVLWVGAGESYGLVYRSGAVFNLLLGGGVGLFAVVGVQRLSPVFLMILTGMLAYWLGDSIFSFLPAYSQFYSVLTFVITLVQGTILTGGMFLWGGLSLPVRHRSI